MPAIKLYPRRTNPQAFDAGLILQSKPRIECNEFGMQQATLQFLCDNKHWPRLAPRRGTPVDQFQCGDDSIRILKAYNFLGAQTSGFTRNGNTPGIGLLEVMCQGAIFDVLDGVYPVYDAAPADNAGDLILPRGTHLYGDSVTFVFQAHAFHTLILGTTPSGTDLGTYRASGGVQSITVSGLPTNGARIYVQNVISIAEFYNLPPGTQTGVQLVRSEFYVFDTGPISIAPSGTNLDGHSFGDITTPLFQLDSTLQSIEVPIIDTSSGGTGNDAKESVILQYHTLDLRYEYMARDLSQRPRFIQSTYGYDDKFLVYVGDKKFQLLIDKADVQSSGHATFDFGMTFDGSFIIDRLANPLNFWKQNVSLIGTGAQFQQIPSGPYYHVIETAQIQFKARPLGARGLGVSA